LALTKPPSLTGEGNASHSTVRYIPAIIGFLGYDPQLLADSIPELLATARRRLGLPERKMATMLGVDPATLIGWEAGGISQPGGAWM